MTNAERRIWSKLRNNQFGIKFRRQVPFDKYILDFYCAKLKLCIELDGSQHYIEEGRKKDIARDRYLKAQGVEVIRFSDYEALSNTIGVLQTIYEKINESLSHETPS